MTADSLTSKALLRVKRRNYFVCALFLAAGLVVHCLVTRTVSPPLVIMQCLWGASYLLLGLGVGAGLFAPQATAVVAGFIALVGSAAFVTLTGGVRGPYFHAFAALPLLVAMFTPDARLPTLASGVSTMGAVALMGHWHEMPLTTVLPQVAGIGLFVGLALFSTRTYRRMGEAQRVAHREKLEMLERLAESERRRRHAERERAEVDRLVLVGQLAAGVAHEVNNPLAFVKANLNYLEHEVRGEELPRVRDELLQVISETQQGVLRIQQIVMDLRGFSRAGGPCEERGGALEVALPEATRMASVRLRERGEVSLALEPGLPLVRLGHRHIVQVVLNLLINAADAVEMCQTRCLAHIAVRAWRVEEGVRLEVDDNGPGIPADVLPRLFEPFFTTKPPGKGTGLGLALCREFVSRSGGTLHAENRPGGGARFVIVLPVSEESRPLTM
ncbi:sensor histidine kinase [Melittangium boletus]|uniref:sensor histidine kinase n=1 Tax=Melittangium boletus TaxID=83453 RepID=UPI003DA22C9C